MLLNLPSLGERNSSFVVHFQSTLPYLLLGKGIRTKNLQTGLKSVPQQIKKWHQQQKRKWKFIYVWYPVDTIQNQISHTFSFISLKVRAYTQREWASCDLPYFRATSFLGQFASKLAGILSSLLQNALGTSSQSRKMWKLQDELHHYQVFFVVNFPDACILFLHGVCSRTFNFVINYTETLKR